ncbi:Nn.00g014330.m01.CDS01 [Neocucurbitaria sp. VM-36]
MGAVKMFTPYDLRPTIEITAFVLAAVSTLVVTVRFYCRIWVVGRLKLYDYIMLAALVRRGAELLPKFTIKDKDVVTMSAYWVPQLCTWALCACNHYQLLFGSGAQDMPKDLPKISPEKMEALAKLLLFGSAASWYAYHIGYLAITGLIKLSILTFYLSFATHRTFRILVYVSIVIVTGVSIFMIFILAFQCPKDPSYALSPAILLDRGAGHCFDLRFVFYWQAGFNIGSDVFILILPMPLLVSLRMNTAKRISIMAVFSIGLLVPIASGVRLWAVYLWANSGDLARYYGGYIIFWSQVEINTAIICASAPSLQPLFTRIFGELYRFQRPRGSYYYYGGGGNSIAEPSIAEIIRSVPRDSISILERPVRVHQPPKSRIQDERQAQVDMMKRSLGEEEIRNRVRAFSSQSSLYSRPLSPSSSYSTPTSPMRPDNILRSDWV